MQNRLILILRKIWFLSVSTTILAAFLHHPLFAQSYNLIKRWVDRGDTIIFADIIRDYPTPAPRANKSVIRKDPSTGQSSYLIRLLPIGDRSATAKVLEVLKGDLQNPYVHFRINYKDLGIGKYIILLRKNSYDEWEEVGVSPADSLATIRCFIPVFEEKNETARIQKLVHLIQDPSAVCPQVDWKWTVDALETDLGKINTAKQNPASLEALNDGVLFEIKELENPASFDIVVKYADSFSASGKKDLLEWMISTGDTRAVPVLLHYMDSEDSNLRSTAAIGLSRHFPGAPGVTEAFLQKWKATDKRVRSVALEYLVKRKLGLEIQEAYEMLHALPDPKDSSLTFSQKARKAFREGQTAEARKYCIQAIEDDSLYDRERLNLMDCLATALSREDRSRYLPAAAPFLGRMINARNDSAAYNAIKIVLDAKHPAMKQALVDYLNRENTFSSSRWLQDAYRSVMALREMGDEARTMGARVLLDRIENASYGNLSDYRTSITRLIALLWLGKDQDFYRARELILKNISDYFDLVTYLKPLSKIEDEGAFWIDLLNKYQNQSWNMMLMLNWFYIRLGDLEEARAIPLFLRCLEDRNAFFSMEAATEALVKLGEPAYSRMYDVLINSDLPDHSYAAVFGVLSELQKEEALPFMRRLVRERHTDLPYTVWDSFFQYGAVEDIALLSGLYDYWEFGPNTGLQNALATLREKYNYDINGPVLKNNK